MRCAARWVAGLGLCLVGCGEISRIDPEDVPVTVGHVSGPSVPVAMAAPDAIRGDPGRAAPQLAIPTRNNAAEAQLRRLEEAQTDIALIPSTQPVSGAAIDDLRRQRQAAQAAAASIRAPSPEFGAQSGPPVFAMPDMSRQRALARAIGRAQQAEAEAMTRPGSGF